jgi:dynactin 1
MTKYKIGQTVELTQDKSGVIKYIGELHFSEGIFYGVDIGEPKGKNDGEVRGQRYFECPEGHGIFVRDVSILRIISEPPPVPAKVQRPKMETSATNTRTSSIGGSRPAPSRSSSTATAPTPRNLARQSIVTPPSPSPRTTTLRAPVRKGSIAASSTPPTSESQGPQSSTGSRPSTSSVSSQSTLKTARDSNADALKTKIKHLEKQNSDQQDNLKELAAVKEERDKFETIFRKLDTKCQTLRQETVDLKEKLRSLQQDNDRLVKQDQDNEYFMESATTDQQMAELRAEQAEEDLMELRKVAEDRELELELLRDELKTYQTDMSEEDKKEAGYYRLKADNEKLRDALRLLKDYTDENVADYKAQISEMEEDILELDDCKQNNASLQERLAKGEAIIEHLQQQVDAANDFEDMVGELTIRNQELEDKVANQYLVVQDLENLKELNDELELQHIETAEELRADIEAKYLEIAEQQQRIAAQSATIAEQEDLVSRFRDLVFDLQSRMADAESSKTLTEAQAKDTIGKVNEVMDMNRRLRAADVSATSKDITSDLRKLKAEQATEMLEVWLETGSKEFGKTASMRAYLAAKRVTSKSALLSKLLLTADRHMSYGGSLDEASSKLYCVEAVYHLTNITTGSERLWSAMSASSLQDFANFGPAYDDLVAIEKILDQGLEALKTDRINFSELAGSFGRSTKTQEALLSSFQGVLTALPEDETISSVRSIAASVTYLDTTFSVMNAMLVFVASTTELEEDAQDVLELFAAPSAACSKGKLAVDKLLKTCSGLRDNALYPELGGHLEPVADQEATLANMTREAAEWAHNAMKLITQAYDLNGDIFGAVDLRQLLGYFWKNKMWVLDGLVPAINSWQEHASVLKNNMEIQREVAPWIAKAKEVELAKKQEEQASVRLQMIATEHQTTILKLHEREKVIETKELEIEHLSAKYREATAKHKVMQGLEEEVSEAKKQIQSLQEVLKTQQAEMEERSARSEKSEAVDSPTAAPAAAGRTEAAEHALVSTAVPASTLSLVEALEDENRFMRRRELTDKLALQIKGFQAAVRAEVRSHAEDLKMQAAKLDALDDMWMEFGITRDDITKARQERRVADVQTQEGTDKAQEEKHLADEQARTTEEKWVTEKLNEGPPLFPTTIEELRQQTRQRHASQSQSQSQSQNQHQNQRQHQHQQRTKKPVSMASVSTKRGWKPRVLSGDTLLGELEQGPCVEDIVSTLKKGSGRRLPRTARVRFAGPDVNDVWGPWL